MLDVSAKIGCRSFCQAGCQMSCQCGSQISDGITPIFPPFGRKECFEYLLDHFRKTKSQVIMEVGTTRQKGNWSGDGYSTPLFAYIINTIPDSHLFSIDISQKAIDVCSSILREYNLDSDKVHLIIQDAILFLNAWNTEKKINLLYLDGWDWLPQKKLSESEHLRAFKVIEKSLASKAFVLIDDIHNSETYEGKGKLLIPYLIEKGYTVIKKGYQFLFQRNS